MDNTAASKPKLSKKNPKMKKDKLKKKLQEHARREQEKYESQMKIRKKDAGMQEAKRKDSGKPDAGKQEAGRKDAGKSEPSKKTAALSLAQIINQKRVKVKQKQHKLHVTKRDIWNSIDMLERRVDYNLCLLTCTQPLDKPDVDEEIWNQFISLDFTQSVEQFLSIH
ncbi:uncharacterized protein LOC115221013 [Argonauta hians]